MKAVGSALWSVPRAIGRRIWRVASLIHNFDSVHEAYDDVPVEALSEQQLAARNMAANLIGGAGTSSM